MVQTHGSITLGRPGRKVNLEGLQLIESRYEPSRVLNPHAHRSGNITLVFEGAFEESVGGRVFQPRSASFVVKPGGTVHSNRYGPQPVRAFVIEIAPRREAELGMGAADSARWFDGGPSVGLLLEIYAAFVRGDDDLERITLEGLGEVLRMTVDESTLRGVGRTGATHLARADAILRANIAHAPNSRELARRVGVHPVYLARLFRAANGCGIAAYRRKLQVRAAARRLAEDLDPQAGLAVDAGFADQSHMCRAFKAELGLTPGAYRSLIRA